MAKKDISNSTSPKNTEMGTAPEVPLVIAKQYNLHKEPLHQAAAPADVAEDTPPKTDTAEVEASTVDNPETDAVVDEIIAKESDELLDISNSSTDSHPPARSTGFGVKLKHFFQAWWRNKVARYITLGIVGLGILTVSVVPSARYAVLNTLGVRSSASVVVLDNTTQLPLKNVSVSLNDKTIQTNREGVATITGLKLGTYQLKIKRLAFASHTGQVTIGWGSNPLGDFRLKAVGTQYQLNIKDYLAGKPIKGAEAESDQLNALSDEDGKVTLTVEDTNVTQLTVTLSAPGYRSETLNLDAATESIVPVVLVPAQKAVYVSKASGKYDVYASDIDGHDKKIILAGTGLENDMLSLVLSPNGRQAAVVSTRDKLHDKDGYLLYALTFINLETGTSVTVDHAQQIQLIDWIDDRLIYRLTVAGASASNMQRNRLIAYNFASNARTQLANANHFNTILSANGYVYYGLPSEPGVTTGLFRVKTDNTGRERVVTQEVWTGLRTSQNSLSLQTPGGWLQYDLQSKKVTQSTAPATFASTIFSTRGTRTAWTEQRDNKGVLLLQDGAGQARSVASQPGLTYPVYWLNDSVLIYRVVTSTESADFAVSINGGAPRKISDVTATHAYVQAY